MVDAHSIVDTAKIFKYHTSTWRKKSLNFLF